MKYCYLLTLLFIAQQLCAQDCNKELLRQKPGSWKAGQQGSIQNINAADLVKEKATLAAIHKLLNAGYHPTGCQVSYSTVYGKQPSAAKNWLADPYNYTMYLLPYLCDNNNTDKSKYHVAIASATNVSIAANAIYTLNNLYAASLPDDDFRGYLKLKLKPQKKDGAWFMGEEIVGDYGTASEVKEVRWLITYDEKLPFVYLSRKEYLQIQKKRLEQTMKEEGASDFYKKFMNNINQQLQQPAEDLNKPAVCPWNDEQRFTGFVAEGAPGSFIAVKPNPDYYNKQLPLSSPQFFTVIYKISKGDPVFEDNINAIQLALNFSTLKNMLRK
jgi:hypothetical protein